MTSIAATPAPAIQVPEGKKPWRIVWLIAVVALLCYVPVEIRPAQPVK